MPPKNDDNNNKPQGNKPAPFAGRRKRGDTFCRLEDGEWYCYKMDGGQACQCGGPYATREECEAGGCSDG